MLFYLFLKIKTYYDKELRKERKFGLRFLHSIFVVLSSQEFSFVLRTRRHAKYNIKCL